MGDAARHGNVAQALEQLVGRAAHMQDHRQIEPARQLQLRTVKLLLPRGIQSIGKKIQPDFADGHQARVTMVLLQRLGQQRQVGIGRPRGVERVDAQRVAVAVAVRQLAHGIPVGTLHRRNHAMRHACCSRLLAHGVAVGGKLGGVQVAVRIDPGRHADMMPDQRAPGSGLAAARQRPGHTAVCINRRSVLLSNPCATLRRDIPFPHPRVPAKARRPQPPRRAHGPGNGHGTRR